MQIVEFKMHSHALHSALTAMYNVTEGQAAAIQFDSEGIKVLAVNCYNTILFSLNIATEGMLSYNLSTAEPANVGIEEQLKDILSFISPVKSEKKSTEVTVQIESTPAKIDSDKFTYSMTVYYWLYGALLTTKIDLVDPQLARSPGNALENFSFKKEWATKAKELKTLIKLIEDRGFNRCVFRIGASASLIGTPKWEAEGKIWMGISGWLQDGGIDGECASCAGLDHVKDILKSAPPSEFVTLKIDNDYPLYFGWQIADGVNVVNVLAPLIDA